MWLLWDTLCSVLTTTYMLLMDSYFHKSTFTMEALSSSYNPADSASCFINLVPYGLFADFEPWIQHTQVMHRIMNEHLWKNPRDDMMMQHQMTYSHATRNDPMLAELSPWWVLSTYWTFYIQAFVCQSNKGVLSWLCHILTLRDASTSDRPWLQQK